MAHGELQPPILTQVWAKGIKRWAVRYTNENKRIYQFLDAAEGDVALAQARAFLATDPRAAAYRDSHNLVVKRPSRR